MRVNGATKKRPFRRRFVHNHMSVYRRRDSTCRNVRTKAIPFTNDFIYVLFFFFCWMRAKDALFIAIVDWECINEIGQTKETSKHSLLYKDNTVRRAAFNLVQNKMYRQRSKPKKKENKERGIQVNLSYFYLFWSVLLASLSQLFLSTEQELHCYWMFWVSNWISIVRTIQLRPKQIFRLQITEMEWNMYI